MEHEASQEFCQDPKPVILGPPLPATHSGLLPAAERGKAEDRVRHGCSALAFPLLRWRPGQPPLHPSHRALRCLFQEGRPSGLWTPWRPPPALIIRGTWVQLRTIHLNKSEDFFPVSSCALSITGKDFPIGFLHMNQ